MEGEEEEGEGAATTSRQQQQKLRRLAPMLKRRGGSPLSPLVGIFHFEKGEQPNGGGRQRGSASLPTGFGRVLRGILSVAAATSCSHVAPSNYAATRHASSFIVPKSLGGIAIVYSLPFTVAHNIPEYFLIIFFSPSVSFSVLITAQPPRISQPGMLALHCIV